VLSSHHNYITIHDIVIVVVVVVIIITVAIAIPTSPLTTPQPSRYLPPPRRP
jgi:quinol-cytochrome oxidoreductase complex cytochrome b subunit